MKEVQGSTTLNNSKMAGGFAPVYYSLFGVRELKTNDVLVYSHMANDYLFYLNERGQYQPSEQVIADKLNMSLSTVKRSIKTLEKLKYIAPVSKKKGCCTVWHVNKINDDGLPMQSKPKITKRTEVMTGGTVKANTDTERKHTNNVISMERDVPEWASSEPPLRESPF
ncbi:helix-turn-helix domain-containing protein [Vibrio mediterranei]|uniref:helix-turn-helix domain-containing protein n=1 Tax=Vibrio mediterranei TaxID=689 RepID=UPI00148E46A0|nr:helix-turn-helix domain-containing protein [Vibrio mediterranei]